MIRNALSSNKLTPLDAPLQQSDSLTQSPFLIPEFTKGLRVEKPLPLSRKLMSFAGWSESSLGISQRRPKDIKERPLVHSACIRAHSCNRNFPHHIDDRAGYRAKGPAPAAWVVSVLLPLPSGLVIVRPLLSSLWTPITFCVVTILPRRMDSDVHRA